jgi:hypothetical protein
VKRSDYRFHFNCEGMLLRALLDQSKTSWYHAMNDRSFNNKNIFDVVNDILTSQGELGVLNCVSVLSNILAQTGRTAFPCRLFVTMYSSFADDFSHEYPDFCIVVPQLNITPCREAVEGFHVEMSNRVLRKYVNERGMSPISFLRVHITDEDGQKLRYFDLESEAIESRIRTVLSNGIQINGHLYEFLAYSSSQLKELSVWMASSEIGYTAETIRNSLGSFSDWKESVNKLAARIGQCFSNTMEGSKDTDAGGTLRRGVIPDITSVVDERTMCHSDGVGLIRREKLDELLSNPPFSKTPGDVSIIQIRYGGAKGTLVAWDFDELSNNYGFGDISTHDVLLRKSMIKFTAPYESIEVCGTGKKVPYYLNRHVILLLVACGIDANVIEDMAKAMIQDLNKMLQDGPFLMSMLLKLSVLNQDIQSNLLNMLQMGLSPSYEPFLFSCAHALRSHHLYGLRKKTRIFVEKGAVLMGGIDETGLLPEGCVFINIQSREGDIFSPIVGPVMVTKHPVMYVGDLRMLLAVDEPMLRKHRNVLLFSKHGNRPEASKMSGSDLDGDEFAITWDPRLFLQQWNCCISNSNGYFTSKSKGAGNMSRLATDKRESTVRALSSVNYEPLDEPQAPISSEVYSDLLERLLQKLTISAPSIVSKCNSKELIQVFINFAKNDVLGAISMLWLDHAAEKGAGCNECKLLAQQHSIAVDFAKSGVPGSIPKQLRFDQNKKRPHWREAKGFDFYHDDGILGRVYDLLTTSDVEKSIEKVPASAGRKQDRYGQLISSAKKNWISRHLHQIFHKWIPVDCGLLVGSNERTSEVMDIALAERQSFESEVFTMMNKFKIRSEGELFTGCIRKYHRLHKQRQFKFADKVRRACSALQAEFRFRFFREVWKLDMESKKLNGNISSDEPDNVDLEQIRELATVPALLWKQENDNAKESLRRSAQQLAAAYYVATYSPEFRLSNSTRNDSNTEDAVDDDNIPLFAFPWIVADVLSAAITHDEKSGVGEQK